ncbi:hypothetical protein JSO59_011150 [Riemerella anatipestifer]|uniref:hypothetical protein n=1 Tax=Riemerella anatipestifer TaxID=34085 RepID=UPI0030C11C00
MPPNDKYTFGYAEADILVDSGRENKLYRGKVGNYYLCHNTNHLQTIVLRDAKKYEKNDNETIVKDIIGDNFVIEKDRILNINFTYVFVLKDKQKHIKVIKTFIDVVSVILYLWISIVAVFFKMQVNEYLYTMPRKLVFLICGLFVMLTLKDFFKILVFKQWSKFKIEHLLFLFVMLTPSIWVFDFFRWYWVLGIELFLITIFTGLLPEEDREQKSKKVETSKQESK